MKKIITRVFGGLGNQLFCYAAARRLAIANSAELVIDDVSGFEYDGVYQRHYQLDHFNIPCRKATKIERFEPCSRVRRYLKRSYSRLRPFEVRTYIQQEMVDFDPRLLRIRPQGTLYLEGYWQSEDYFKDIEAIIRSDLQIQAPTDDANLAMVSRILGCTAVAVHIRFFDAPGVVGLNNVASDYYRRAIEKMEGLTVGAHYFVFSDRLDCARKCIDLPDERVTCVAHNQGDLGAYADLWLMSQCRHFIIANSTFSWWGAWLSGHTEKHVIAPGVEIRENGFITAWGFKGLLPTVWNII